MSSIAAPDEPPRLSREEQRRQTREDLLAAAALVFARKGYHGTSVDMVAEAAGYTKGAVYSNFSSKEDLFLALFEARHEESLGAVEQLMENASPGERAAAFGAAPTVPTWQPDWFLLEAEFELYAARNPEVRDRVSARQRQTLDVVAATVQRYLDELGLDAAYPVDELARLIVAAGDGLSLMALNNPDAVDTGALMQVLLEILARGAVDD